MTVDGDALLPFKTCFDSELKDLRDNIHIYIQLFYSYSIKSIVLYNFIS